MVNPDDIAKGGGRGPWPRTKGHLDELIGYIANQPREKQLAAIDFWVSGLMMARAIIEGGPEVEKFVRGK